MPPPAPVTVVGPSRSDVSAATGSSDADPAETGWPSGSSRATEEARREALFWTAVVALAVAVFLSWLPALTLSLGDSHEGRILARQGLQARNFWESGAVESGFGTVVDPYPLEPYAHHPPLVNAIQIAVTGALGDGAWQLRLLGYLSGAAVVVLWAALARSAGLGRRASLVAVAMGAATPLFWIYERIGIGYLLVLVLSVLAVRHERGLPRSGGLGAAAFFAAIGSWPGLLAAVIWTAVFAARGERTVALRMGLGSLASVAVTTLWVAAATTPAELFGHLAQRTVDSGVSIADVLVQQAYFLGELLPRTWVVLAPVAVAAGLLDRRTRTVMGVLVTVNLVWAFGLPEGAFVHDFWNLGVLPTVVLGVAALFDGAVRALPSAAVWTTAALLVAAGAWSVVDIDGQRRYFEEPSRAGVLLENRPPPPSQNVLWVSPGVAAPRWASWHWDLPVARAGATELENAPPSDLLLVRLDRPDPWLVSVPETLADAADGRYALLEVGVVHPGPSPQP